MNSFLGVIKEISECLVVFKFALSEEDLHCILDGNGINGGECFLHLFKGDVKVVFQISHRRFKSGGSGTGDYNSERVNIPS